MSRYRLLAPIAAWIVASTPVISQSTSASAVGELASLLNQEHLDSVAARVPGTEDTFVAAFYVPGQQLILVSGRYAAPTLLREKILSKRYRDAYQDLYGASDPASRWIVEDLRADGLRFERSRDTAADVYTRGGSTPVFFDGDWKGRKLSESDYRETFQQAQASYVQMLGVLVSKLKEP